PGGDDGQHVIDSLGTSIGSVTFPSPSVRAANQAIKFGGAVKIVHRHAGVRRKRHDGLRNPGRYRRPVIRVVSIPIVVTDVGVVSTSKQREELAIGLRIRLTLVVQPLGFPVYVVKAEVSRSIDTGALLTVDNLGTVVEVKVDDIFIEGTVRICI